MPRPVPARNPPGPKPRLSRDEIVDVALRVLGEEGPRGLSLRRLGSELGVNPMSLYGYFSSKGELERAIVSRVMPAPPVQPDPADDGRPWHEELRRYVIEIHEAFARQAGAAEFLATGTATSPAMNAVREHLLQLLLGAGLAESDAVSAVGALSRYLMGCVIVESGRRPAADYEQERLSELPGETFPALRMVAKTYAERSSIESTYFGLDLIISGLRNLSAGAERDSDARP